MKTNSPCKESCASLKTFSYLNLWGCLRRCFRWGGFKRWLHNNPHLKLFWNVTLYSPSLTEGGLDFPSPWIWEGLLWSICSGRSNTVTVLGIGLNWPRSCHFLLVRTLSHNIKNQAIASLSNFSSGQRSHVEEPHLGTTSDVGHLSFQWFQLQSPCD